MAPNNHHLTLFHFVFLFIFLSLTTTTNGSNLNSQMLLHFGDAKFIPNPNHSFLQLTSSSSFSHGTVLYNKLVNFTQKGNPERKTSFGIYFSFSLSPDKHGDGLTFFIHPDPFSFNGDNNNGTMFGLSSDQSNKRFIIKFDTKTNRSHVGVGIGSLVPVKVAEFNSLNDGEILHCWIDYEASSKRIEVRLRKYGTVRPVSPVLSYLIDLSKMFDEKSVYLGLSSSNGNSTQICSLYSWSVKLREVPYWMHSHPLDPQDFTKDVEPVSVRKGSDCIVRVMTALFFGTGCGALGAFIALFVWTVLVNKKLVTRDEYAVRPVECECDKVKVIVVEKTVKV